MNKTNEQIEIDAINYLKNTKDRFFEIYLKNCEPLENKTAIFTAGASGSGKTEFAESPCNTCCPCNPRISDTP